MKIAVLILLQAVNFAYVQNAILQGILFFLCISFGFVRFYKENMFRDHISLEQKYCLTQFRRAAYWSYRQAAKIQYRMYFSNKKSPRFTQLNQQYQHATQLHQQLMQAEKSTRDLSVAFSWRNHQISRNLRKYMTGQAMNLTST